MVESLNMSTFVSTNGADAKQVAESKCDIAIRDVDSRLAALDRQRRRLAQAKRLMTRQKRDGVPWPGGGGHD